MFAEALCASNVGFEVFSVLCVHVCVCVCVLLLFMVQGFYCCVLCLQWIGDENEREEGETGRGIETANGIVGTGREKETEIGIGTETGDVSRDLVLGLQ